MDKSVTDFNVRLRTIRLRELIVAIIAAIIISGLIMIPVPELYEDDNLLFIVLLSLVLLFFAWCLRGTHGLDQNIRNLFEIKTRNEILYVFAVNLLFAFLFTCLISGIDLLMGFYDPSWISGFDIDTVDITAGAILFEIVSSVIFAPLMEELIFRGVLFNRLKIRVGILPAMLISSFIFGIGHSYGSITSAFLFGICMCILYMKTDNILVPMSVHFINNVVATVLEFTQLDLVIGQMPWLIPATVIALISTVLLVKYIVQETSTLKNRFS